jgi:hypothetical protein
MQAEQQPPATPPGDLAFAAKHPSYLQGEATRGMYLTLRSFDLAFRQPEATAFPSMLAPC